MILSERISARGLMAHCCCLMCPSRLCSLLALVIAMLKLSPADGASHFSREEARAVRDSLMTVLGIEEPQFVKDSLEDKQRFSQARNEHEDGTGRVAPESATAWRESTRTHTPSKSAANKEHQRRPDFRTNQDV